MEFREKLHRRLPCSLAAPFYIRRALSLLERDVGADTLATLQLLVCELVTNSVTHSSSSAVEVSVAVGDGRLRAEVRDEGPGFRPQDPREDPSRTTGRGLLLVDRLADRWGAGGDGGAGIWFELRMQRVQ